MGLSTILTANDLHGGTADGFPYDTSTAAGRAANRAVVESCMRRGMIVEHLPEPVPDKVPGKHGPHDHWPWVGCEMVKVGRGLVEPFERLRLMKAAKVSESKASNTMTAWRKAGWIAASNGGWTRTRKFGRTS